MKKNYANKIFKQLFTFFLAFSLFSTTVLAEDVSDLNFCSANGVKLALQIIGYAIFVCKIIIPIVLIIYGTMDVSKAVLDAKDGLQKNLIQFAKRCIAAVLIFMAPGVINGLFNILIDDYEEATNDASRYKNCITCLFNPNKSNVKKYGE